ncbi:MAG: hypothetical protein ACRCUY_09330 [Thermoguttaceae bacterium]
MPEYHFLKNYEELETELAKNHWTLPICDDTTVLAKPLSLKTGHLLSNRFVAQPMEGFDSGPDGEPTELTFRRYERFAAGGASLIWFEATAVLHEARSNSQQLWINEKSANRFAALEEKTRSIAKKQCGHDIVSVLQLTHSGRYSKPVRKTPKPIIAHHSGKLDFVQKLPPEYPLISDDELDRLQDAYIYAAKWAAKCGFDGIDIKSCHGYLLNEILASHTRDGKYGGSYENRTRFLKETITRIKAEVPSVFVTSRVSVYDAITFPWGFGVDQNDYKKWDLSEPKRLVKELVELGLPLLNITIGNPYYNPHFNRPYSKAIRGAEVFPEYPLLGVVRFAEIVRELQASCPTIPMCGAGFAWLRHLVPKVAAGLVNENWCALFGQGRGSFAYPDSPKDIIETGTMDSKKVCLACSGCTELMRHEEPTGCVLRDRDFYQLPD